MKFEPIEINGPLIIHPTVFSDARGYFFESYSEALFAKNGVDVRFVQDNQSLSGKGTVRGLHFQAPPYEQGKLVRVITGAVLDVIVDIRTNSPTYGETYTIELTAENKTMFWIPPGFAHGFSTLEDNTVFQYKCTGYYNKPSEGGIRWNDPTLNINWKVADPIISDKDAILPFFNEFTSPF
jgi:dTDP-4-dehydrorhamnose 3,5-epimerase